MVKVFEMNDCDWVAAATLESAVAHYLKEHAGGRSAEDAMDNPHELTEEEMESLIFSDEDRGRSSYKSRLDYLIAERVKFPCLFASTEY